MITSLLIMGVVGLVDLVVNAIGLAYRSVGLPTQLGDSITYFADAMYAYNQFYPISELFVAFKFFIAFESGIFIWNSIWWVYAKFRGATET